jgi:hypothetical protein
MVEVVEKAVKGYKGGKLIQSRKSVKPKSKPKLTPYFNIDFGCDNCGDEYEEDTAYSYAPNLDQLKLKHYPTYCRECVNG